MIRWPSATFAVALLAFALPARADVPPAPNSPDAHCTLEEQCAHGVMCPYTFRPGKPPPPNEPPVGLACRAAAVGKGLERRCRHGGNYAGDELYCPKGETGSWAPPAPAKPPPTTTPASSAPSGNAADAGAAADAKGTSRCSASPLGEDGSAPALPWIAAFVLLWSRARKWRT